VLLWSVLDELSFREAVESGARYGDYTVALSNSNETPSRELTHVRSGPAWRVQTDGSAQTPHEEVNVQSQGSSSRPVAGFPSLGNGLTQRPPLASQSGVNSLLFRWDRVEERRQHSGCHAS
jgi:hypothetical protein